MNDADGPTSSSAPPRSASVLERNQKLTDAQVVEMREVRAKSVADGMPIGWDELGDRYGIHGKTVYRICAGIIRQGCGGPIEGHQSQETQTLARCRCCGGMAVQTEGGCRYCQSEWERAFLRVFRQAGVVRTVDQDRLTLAGNAHRGFRSAATKRRKRKRKSRLERSNLKPS
ncbi:MAG TPA: hypothetical protein VFE62_12285 [Gemmataceae bacterium]|nr:hypothetical protein [Pirellulales bacterium]HZZ79291.1 hypothetical protein [Gemmataceae bacterium]